MKKKVLLWLGWPLIIAGVAVLVSSYFTGLSHYNAVLYIGWLMMTVGCICRVAGMKG